MKALLIAFFFISFALHNAKASTNPTINSAASPLTVTIKTMEELDNSTIEQMYTAKTKQECLSVIGSKPVKSWNLNLKKHV
jgi:hypothetical protein